MFCKLCIILLFFLTFLKSSYDIGGASHVVLEVKNLRIIARDARDSSWIPGSGRRYPGVRRATHSIFLPGKFHGERSLVGYSPAAAAAKSLQSCPTLCDPINSSPPGSPRPWDSPGKNTGVGCHSLLQCMKVKSESKVAQSCPTLSDPMDCSPPGSSIHGIFQSRVLEWGAIAFSEVASDSVAIPWTVAGQAPLSVELPRQEYSPQGCKELDITEQLRD